ncbi:hypothetical protein D3OALGB2SA_861 [Olavius algarvensis associated proteobacterium Delta 3]|nr:hypothetical protein D3OALGB2SA_861 [Olavius algarvensis associated proteobacterium Delta 3]
MRSRPAEGKLMQDVSNDTTTVYCSTKQLYTISTKNRITIF